MAWFLPQCCYGRALLGHIFTALGYGNISNREDNFDTHVLSLMHNLPIYKHLVRTDSVAHCVGWVRGCRNLDLAPLLVGRHQFALGGESLKLLVNSLFFDAAFALDKR